jgi:Tol biopolymer transport system component
MAIRALVSAVVGLTLVTSAGGAAGNGNIAYFRDSSLFVASADGSGEAKVADDHSDGIDNGLASWSPDGAHLAYLDAVRSAGLIDFVPTVAGADGSNPRHLAAHGDWKLACWLDPSTLVATDFRETSTNPATVDQDLYGFGLDGAVTRLTTDGGTKYVSAEGCAPDGSGVAYTKQQPDFTSKIEVAGRTGGAPVVVTPNGENDSPPSWSPANELAFARYGADSGLYVASPSGGTARMVTSHKPALIRWSPDGTKIAYEAVYTDESRCSKFGCPTTYDVTVIGVDGSAERTLAETRSETSLGWSPDGTRIFFGQEARPQYLVNADGTCKTAMASNVPPVIDWQPVAGKPAEPPITCAGLSVSTDVSELDLWRRGSQRYTVTVRNVGNEIASAVALDQPAAADVSIESVTPSSGTCSHDGGFDCDLGPLRPGASASASISVSGTSSTSLMAQASAPEPDGDPYDNTADVSVVFFDCTILGTIAADTLYGTRGRDTICGRFGNDEIYGGRGADIIFGGEGADIISGGPGRDIIDGGGGEDVILARDNTRDVIDCGPQKDVAVVDRFDIVTNCKTVYRPPKRPKKR